MADVSDDDFAQLVEACGSDVVLEYRDIQFPNPVFHKFYSANNWAKWLNKESFLSWYADQAQSTPPPALPVSKSKSSSGGFLTAHHTPRPSSAPPLSSTSLPSRSVSPALSSSARSEPADFFDLSGDDNGPPVTHPSAQRHSKRAREATVSPPMYSTPTFPDPIIQVTSSTPKKKRVRKKKEPAADGLISITRKTKVKEIIPTKILYNCWSVPNPDCHESFAYVVDFSDIDSSLGKSATDLSVIALITKEDQDAWDGNHGGKTTEVDVQVLAEDGASPVRCRAAYLVCEGIHCCSELDSKLLDNCERYVADPAERQDLWNSLAVVERGVERSPAAQAVAFYHDMRAKRCPWIRKDGTLCGGVGDLRKKLTPGYNGVEYFIGCSRYHASDPPHAHHAFRVPHDVKEDLLVQLFHGQGLKATPELGVLESGKCAYSTPPRHTRASGTCPYPHISADGQPVQGQVVKRKCTTKMTIWYPVDQTDRRAVILLVGPHEPLAEDAIADGIDAPPPEHWLPPTTPTPTELQPPHDPSKCQGFKPNRARCKLPGTMRVAGSTKLYCHNHFNQAEASQTPPPAVPPITSLSTLAPTPPPLPPSPPPVNIVQYAINEINAGRVLSVEVFAALPEQIQRDLLAIADGTR